MAIVYAITLSESNIDKVINGGGTTAMDAIWFISFNQRITRRVVNYFENINCDDFKDIMKSIMLVDDLSELSRPLFETITFHISESDSIMRDILPVIDMILPVGLQNRCSTRRLQQCYHSKFINNDLLFKIKNDFENDNII